MDLKPVQAGPTGFEPATIGLKARRSTWLSYRPNAHLGRASDRTSLYEDSVCRIPSPLDDKSPRSTLMYSTCGGQHGPHERPLCPGRC